MSEDEKQRGDMEARFLALEAHVARLEAALRAALYVHTAPYGYEFTNETDCAREAVALLDAKESQ